MIIRTINAINDIDTLDIDSRETIELGDSKFCEYALFLSNTGI